MSGTSVSVSAGAVLALVGVAAVVLLGPTLVKRAGAAAAAAADAVNPLNHDNVFATGVNSALDAVVAPDGPGRNADGSITAGGWLFDLWNPETAAAVKAITQPVAGPAPAPAPGDAFDSVGGFYGQAGALY